MPWAFPAGQTLALKFPFPRGRGGGVAAGEGVDVADVYLPLPRLVTLGTPSPAKGILGRGLV